jgi:hypothetical protein
MTSPLGVRLDSVTPSTASSPPTIGYGPLWSMTPGASVNARNPSSLAGFVISGPMLATTSGPAVASRVV